MNILNTVKGILLSDAELQTYINSRIYYYKVTENAETSKPFVVITPIMIYLQTLCLINILVKNT